jgi:hypothetical protein
MYGEPIVFKPKGKKVTREDIDEATEQIMRKIAAMLPPEYRGVYGTAQGRSEEVWGTSSPQGITPTEPKVDGAAEPLQ